jgi:3-oxoacyl-[acyl-carrier protein] reductase
MTEHTLSLHGEVALITGGTSGIGKAIAKLFSSAGATVIIFGTNSEKGDKAAQEISHETKGNVIFKKVDVSLHQAVLDAVELIVKEFQKVDILVNCAGITLDNLMLKMKEEEWDKVIAVNLKSCFNACKALMRPMVRAKKGKIINISSIVGLTGNAGQTNYAASKAGMIGFTKALAKELAGRVHVNCIAPGYIETNMTDELNSAQKDAIVKNIPMGRIGKPEEIAYTALFLASPWSNFITGQVITVDGGMVM